MTWNTDLRGKKTTIGFLSACFFGLVNTLVQKKEVCLIVLNVHL